MLRASSFIKIVHNKEVFSHERFCEGEFYEVIVKIGGNSKEHAKSSSNFKKGMKVELEILLHEFL